MDQVTAVVDFGTSHTVVVVSGPGLPARLVSVGGDPWFPSAFFLTRDGRGVVGKDALRLGRAEPARLERRPKARIDEDEIVLGDTVVSTSVVVRTVLVHAIAEAVTAARAVVAHLVLTHPADWGPARLGQLLYAAQGLVPRLSTMREPVAAAAWFSAEHGLPVGSVLGVLDLGGGTCDLALVRREPTGLEVVANAGLPDLGGDDLDQRIVAYLAHGRELPHDEVRAAKEALSRQQRTEVAPDVPLTRTEFEERVRPDLTRAADLLDETLRAAGLSTSDIMTVYLVGGSSRVPLLAQLLRSRVTAPVRLAHQPEAVVALGAEVTARPAVTEAPPRDPDVTGPVPVDEFGEPPPEDHARRAAAIAAVVIIAAMMLGLAALIDLRGFGGTVDGVAQAPSGAVPQLMLPDAAPGSPVTAPGRSTARLPLAEARTFVDYVHHDSTVGWRLDSFDDGDEVNDSLTELGNEPAPDHHWALVRYTVKATEVLAGGPDLNDQLYLVDDRGLMISPLDSFKSPVNSGTVNLPQDCPEPVTGPVAAGAELARCALYAVPDATPIDEVAISHHSNDNPLPGPNEAAESRGARVAVTGRAATGAPAPEPDGTRSPGSPVPMRSGRLDAHVAVVDLIEDSSSYLEETLVLGGSRGVVVRVAVRLTAPAPASSLTDISVALLDDRGAPVDPAVLPRTDGCVDTGDDGDVSGTVALCVLFAVPTETTARVAVVEVGKNRRTWRLP